MKKYIPFACMLLIMLVAGTACTSVKPYQRAYLNDADMVMGTMPSEAFENDVQVYREAALQIRRSKGSGGCGCN